MKLFLLCLFCVNGPHGLYSDKMAATQDVVRLRQGMSERLLYMDNMAATQDAVRRYEGISRLTCSRNCLEMDNCMSYFFNQLTSVCRLHNTVIPASAASTDSPGEEYYQLLGAMSSTTGASSETTTSSGSDGTCPAPHIHIPLADMCILVNEQPAKWPAASAWCMEEGDHLLVLNSVHKQILVTQYIIQNYADDGLGFYMGVRYNSGDWRWENGNKISKDLGTASFYWMTSYPIAVSGGLKYAIISPQFGGKWVNGLNIKRKFICQKDMD